jgi:formamidopyrimidine-DNA glycosylase
MPELPEVETTCLGIRSKIEGKTIERIVIREGRLRWSVPPVIPTLKNLKILEVSRRAKYIFITTNQGTLIIHLGMSGRLSILESGAIPKKHDHIDFIFKHKVLLRYTDPRRFGAVLWTTENPKAHPLLARLGPEPLSKAFTADYLYQKAQKKSTMVKQLIMNQEIVVGVGNIYANEALFAAKLSPIRKCNTLTQVECKNLVKEIRLVLKKAIRQGGTTLRDFLTPDGKLGYFVQKLLVYGRDGDLCIECSTILTALRINQRSTFYCNFCQK